MILEGYLCVVAVGCVLFSLLPSHLLPPPLPWPLLQVLVTDFFGSQRPVELMDALLQDYNLTTPPDGGARGVGSTAEVQTAEEPKTISTGQQAKQLDEHDHLVSETLLVWHSILRIYTCAPFE